MKKIISAILILVIASTMVSFTTFSKEKPEPNESVINEEPFVEVNILEEVKEVSNLQNYIVDGYTMCDYFPCNLTYYNNRVCGYSVWEWSCKFEYPGILSIYNEENNNFHIIVSTNKFDEYMDIIAESRKGNVQCLVEPDSRYYVYFLSNHGEETFSTLHIDFEEDIFHKMYREDSNSKWFTFEQWMGLAGTTFTSNDLRYMTTMVFWEVGKIMEDVEIMFPDTSYEYNWYDDEVLKMLVAQVLYNRTVYSEFFNDNIYDNLLRKNQYHVDYVKEYDGYFNTANAVAVCPEAWAATVDACIKVLTETTGYNFPHEMIFQSNYPPNDMEPYAENHLGSHSYAVVDVNGHGSTCYFSFR